MDRGGNPFAYVLSKRVKVGRNKWFTYICFAYRDMKVFKLILLNNFFFGKNVLVTNKFFPESHSGILNSAEYKH